MGDDGDDDDASSFGERCKMQESVSFLNDFLYQRRRLDLFLFSFFFHVNVSKKVKEEWEGKQRERWETVSCVLA